MSAKTKILLIAFLSSVFIACKKSESPVVTATSPTLVGTWRLVTDSSSSYSQNLGSHGGKYLGTSSDKFIFTSNGTAYVDEQAVIDTGSYTINPDHSIEIVYPSRTIAGVHALNSADYFKINFLDTHKAVLADEGWSPGGVYFVRIVTLSK